MPHAAYPHDFPADASSRRVPHQPWVNLTSARHGLLFAGAHLSCFPQTPSVPANGQAEGHREEMPPPIRGISGSSGAQYPHHVDVGYQGIVDFRPQPVAVSDFYRFTIGPPLINDSRGIRIPHMYSRM